MDAREQVIKQKWDLLAGELNERTRRLVAASEAMTIGRGGISLVSRATGLSRKAISQGIKELKERPEESVESKKRLRRPGGGRKKTVSKDQHLCEELERLVEPVTRGDPESPLRWTCKSVRQLATELVHQGHQVSHQLVSGLLHTLGYSLQANRKTREGDAHPDRNAQFEHINDLTQAFLTDGVPVISVDAKKKEAGQQAYPQANRLLICADGGGSNGSRVRLWKWELQRLADEIGLAITVSHLPPGTSKWNKIEHRLFAFISQNWRSQPLISYEVIIRLIAATTTSKGLTVQCQLDRHRYPLGRKISDEEMTALRIQRDNFHGEWNYKIIME
jgi:transposase